MVSATADGASVNMGNLTGTLTQLQHERPWMLKIHCVNHRVELAVKDVMSQDPNCAEADKFYIDNFYLLKNSGVLKSKLKEAAAALNITYYPLPKIHGTRFVSHRKRGFGIFLHMWPAFITMYNDAIFTTKCGKTKAKISGLLKKFKGLKTLLNVCSSLDILNMVSPISLTFEADSLMPYEVSSCLGKFINAVSDLKELSTEEIKDDDERAINFFKLDECEDPLMLGRKMAKLTHEYPNAGDERKKDLNQKFHAVKSDEIHGDIITLYDAAVIHLKAVLSKLKTVIGVRFTSFENPVFHSMKIFDPMFWNNEDKAYGVEEIDQIYDHFKEPLKHAGFNVFLAKKEWRSLKGLVQESYKKFTAWQLWRTIITMRGEKEYQNICLLIKLVMCISENKKIKFKCRTGIFNTYHDIVRSQIIAKT